MKALDHLLGRALPATSTRPIEPLVAPSPLGPTPFAPAEPPSPELLEDVSETVAAPASARPEVVAPSPRRAEASPAPRVSPPPAPVTTTSASVPDGQGPTPSPTREAAIVPAARPASPTPAIAAPAPRHSTERPAVATRRIESSTHHRSVEVVVQRERVEPPLPVARPVVASPAAGFAPPSPLGGRRERPLAPVPAPSHEEAPLRAQPMRPPPSRRGPPRTEASVGPTHASRDDRAQARDEAPLEPLRIQSNAPAAAPSIEISIGRVVVRAEAPAASPRRSQPMAPRMGLAEYLASREGTDR